MAMSRDAGVSEWPSPWRAWWAVTICCVAGALSYTDRLILSVLVDPIRADLRISDTQISVLQGIAFALIYSVASLPMGRLADRWPRRRVILAGVLIWSAATIACGLANGFSALFAARIFVGVGEAALAPAAISMIGDLFPPTRRGAPVGAFMTGMCLGAGLALSVGGSLLQAVQEGLLAHVPWLKALPPWRVVLLLLALPGLLVCGLLMTVKEPARRASEPGAQTAESTREAFALLLSRRRLVLPIWAAMALLSVGDFSLLNWTPTLLGRVYGLGPAQVGSMLGAVAVLAGVSGNMLFGLGGDRLARRAGVRGRLLLAAGGAVLALGAAAIGVRAGAGLVVACFGLWTFLSWGAQTIGMAAVQNSIPNAVRGLNVACITFCNIVFGLGLGTTTTAVLADKVFHGPLALGHALTFVIAPSSLLAAWLLWRAASAARVASAAATASALVSPSPG